MNRRDAIKNLAVASAAAGTVATISIVGDAPAAAKPSAYMPDGLAGDAFECMASFEEYSHLDRQFGAIRVRWRKWQELFPEGKPTRADIHRVLQLPADAVLIAWGRDVSRGEYSLFIAHESLPVTADGMLAPFVYPVYTLNEDGTQTFDHMFWAHHCEAFTMFAKYEYLI